MKKYSPIMLILILLFTLFSCAPVLRHEIMDAGIRDFSFPDMEKNPGAYEGSLFILGGIIVETKITPEGSLIEALYVPVNSRGYLKDIMMPQKRFRALFPKESGFLDPLIFRRNREITFAGEFQGFRKGEIDGMEYLYPFFTIKELYLWAERTEYYYWPPYREPYPYWWDYPYRWYGPPHWGWRYHIPPPYWW